jgi:hypothetical protein
MTETVPTITKGSPAADMKGVAGSGLASMKSDYSVAVSLSPDLKSVIQMILKKYSSNGTTLAPAEFRKFLSEDQKVSFKKDCIDGRPTRQLLKGRLRLIS